MQDGRDGDEEPGYIGNIQDGATAGFKYFDCRVFMKSQLRHEDMVMGYLKFVPDGMGRYWEVSGYNIQMFGKNTVQRSAFRMECRQSISPIAEVET